MLSAYPRLRSIAVGRFRLLILLVLLLASFPLSAQESGDKDTGDESAEWPAYHWLEDMESEDVLAWVAQQNDKAEAYLQSIPTLGILKAHNGEIRKRQVVKVLNREPPGAELLGSTAQRVSGDTWARMPLWMYALGVIPPIFRQNINDLLDAEPGTYAYDRVECRPPAFEDCLVFYRKRGDRNLTWVREFDADAERWKDSGFSVGRARNTAFYRDVDSIYLTTNLSDPKTSATRLRLWKRGQPLEQAEVLYAAEEFDARLQLRQRKGRLFLVKELRAFDAELFALDDGKLRPLLLPRDLKDFDIVSDQFVVHLKSAWSSGGKQFPAGSLIAAPLDSLDRGQPEFQLIAASTRERVLDEFWSTDNVLIVRSLVDVQSVMVEWTVDDGRWISRELEAPRGGLISVETTMDAVDRYTLWQRTFFDGMAYVREANGKVFATLEQSGAFDEDAYQVDQRFAEAADGERIPYFMIRRKDAPLDGNRPVLMYGYGGWGNSMLTRYLLDFHRWLEDGGVYVLANIRGGGEYGPAWHYAALREKRQTGFSDFQVVAMDLMERGVTRPDRLGIYGGSNGGALVAASFIQRPDLFGAVGIQVGSLEWQRCSQASGMVPSGERGDARIPEEWAFMQDLSPFHNLEAGRDYPPVLLLANRGDDISHPCHSRKFTHRMNELGYEEVYYLESASGGHGGSGTPDAREKFLAFFYDALGVEASDTPGAASQ